LILFLSLLFHRSAFPLIGGERRNGLVAFAECSGGTVRNGAERRNG
jgi:hypothetical protein